MDDFLRMSVEGHSELFGMVFDGSNFITIVGSRCLIEIRFSERVAVLLFESFFFAIGGADLVSFSSRFVWFNFSSLNTSWFEIAAANDGGCCV